MKTFCFHEIIIYYCAYSFHHCWQFRQSRQSWLSSVNVDCLHYIDWDLKSRRTYCVRHLNYVHSRNSWIGNICIHWTNRIYVAYISSQSYLRVFHSSFYCSHFVRNSVRIYEAFRYGNFNIQIISIFVYWNWWYRKKNNCFSKAVATGCSSSHNVAKRKECCYASISRSKQRCKRNIDSNPTFESLFIF